MLTDKDITTIQLKVGTRNRLFKAKERRSYDQFLNELLELYIKKNGGTD